MLEREVVILHLSDLHFGGDWSEQDRAYRELALNDLLRALGETEPGWRPDIVCVSGDVGYRGLEADYQEAEVWFQKLAMALGLDLSRFVVCPGNHDYNRMTGVAFTPSSVEEGDKALTVPIPDYMTRPFDAYSAFCTRLGLPSYRLGTHESYLVGECFVKGVRFLSCNSAWYARAEDPRGKLWLGLPQLQYLQTHSESASSFTVGLVHHPKDYLISEDREVPAGGQRAAAFQVLLQQCNVLLCGHTHEGPMPPDTLSQRCLCFPGGAGYGNAAYFNNCRLLRLTPSGVVHRQPAMNPSLPSKQWYSLGEVQEVEWPSEQRARAAHQVAGIAEAVRSLKDAVLGHAQKLHETKSRQLKTQGRLPEPIEILVQVEPLMESAGPLGARTSDEKRERKLLLPIEQAISLSRLSLVLGDLGSGKSTLVARAAVAMMERTPDFLALVLPVKSLRLGSSLTIGNLCELIDDYITGHVLPSGDTLGVKELFGLQLETLVILDGLDELPRRVASELLQTVTLLPDHWAGVTVVATGRPVELAGVDYGSWQRLIVPELDQGQKLQLLKNEALASEVASESNALDLARHAMRRLRENPLLDAVANTPLATRLLFGPLTRSEEQLSSPTLGDLLHTLLLERLAGWAERDRKQQPYQALVEHCPSALSKAELLGLLALRSLRGQLLFRDEASQLLGESTVLGAAAQRHEVADQALKFFADAGLIVVNSDEGIEFTLQPLAELAAGMALVEKVSSAGPEAIEISIQQWRVVSFGACVARRRGLTEGLIPFFHGFLEGLLAGQSGISASCFIAREFQSRSLAEWLVGKFKSLGRRPLTFSIDEHYTAPPAIAETLLMAGDEGFEWLYEEYLDPRIPPTNTGSAFISAVFPAWAARARTSLKAEQRAKLAKLVPGLRATQPMGAFDFEKTLVLLVPEAFTNGQRLWCLAQNLGSGPLERAAEAELRSSFEFSQRALILGILAQGPDDAGLAAVLWLDLAPQEHPPINVVRKLLSAHAVRPQEERLEGAIRECERRIGTERWLCFLRWTLNDSDSKAAAVAATELMARGEDKLSLLGDPLWRGLHDGGYVPKAEEALDKLVTNAGNEGMKWLVGRLRGGDHDGSAHSAGWRMLLRLMGRGLQNGPRLLARCAAGVGCFVLPRYPEIRHLFRVLMKGEDGILYRAELRKRLDNWDPAARHGAAMILVVADPQGEAQALITVVEARDREVFGYWGEWEKYLASLRFSPAALAALRDELPRLSRQSRELGLAILARNGFPLCDLEEKELVLALAGGHNWALDSPELGKSHLGSGFARAVLVEHLEANAPGKTTGTARALLLHHRPHLTPSQEARCLASVGSDRFWAAFTLGELLERALSDPTFPELLENLRRQLAEGEAAQPLLLHLYSIATKGEGWDDLVWDVLCDDSGIGRGLDDDDRGLQLFWFGKAHPEHGPGLGAAAKRFLHDPRIQPWRWVDRYHWLAVLADEFVGLDPKELQDALCVGQAIHSGAAYSLIGRLGMVPDGFHPKSRPGRSPASVTPGELPPQEHVIINALREVARSSEVLHPEAEASVENAIWYGDVSRDLLDDLAAEGENGRLLAGTLAFCFGRRLRPHWALAFMGRFVTRDRASSGGFERLHKTSRMAFEALLSVDGRARDEYQRALIDAIQTDKLRQSELILELLMVQRGLKEEQIEQVFAAFAQHEGGIVDCSIVGFLARWLVADLSVAATEKVRQACEREGPQLDLDPWVAGQLGARDPSVYLLFTFAYWHCGGPTSDWSVRLMLRGFKLLFEPRGGQQSARAGETMSAIEPLLRSTPPEARRTAIARGITSPDSEVRAWSHIIASFAGRDITP